MDYGNNFLWLLIKQGGEVLVVIRSSMEQTDWKQVSHTQPDKT